MFSNEGGNKKLLCADTGKENLGKRQVVYIGFDIARPRNRAIL